jgi:hypothetical protein
MAGIFYSKSRAGLPKCKRCGRPFEPRKEGDEYGPKCARKMAGKVQLGSMALVSGKVLHPQHKKDILAAKDAVEAYLGAGLA